MPISLPLSARRMLATVEQYEADKNDYHRPVEFECDHLKIEQENKLLLQVDLRILPAASLFVFLSLFDQGNIFTLEFDDMQKYISLQGSQFNHCIMVCIVAYGLFALPSMLCLIKTSPSFWLPTIISCWGVVMTTMGIIHDFSGLFWSRFFLGMFEAGMIPGISFVISMWYRKNELQFRQAVILSVAISANAIGGVVSWTISLMKDVGGLEGWRWVFIIEGSLSVIVGGFGYLIMCNYPANTEILDEKSRMLIQSRVLAADGWDVSELEKEPEDALGDESETMYFFKKLKWNGLESAFLDWQVWLHTLVYFVITTGNYSINILLPRVLQSMEFSPQGIKFVSIPVYIGASVTCILLAIISDKIASRSPVLILSFFMMICGFIVVLLSEVHDTRGSVAYSGIFLASVGVHTAIPGSITWLSNNTMGSAKRIFALAIQIGFGELGGIVATYMYLNTNAAKTWGHSLMIIIACIGLLTVILLTFIYSRINRQRELICASRGYIKVSNYELNLIGDKFPTFKYMS